MPDSQDENVQRSLGKLLAQAENLEKRVDCLSREIKDRRKTHEEEFNKLKSEIRQFQRQWDRVVGGKKVLVIMLAGAAALGGFLIKVAEFLLTYFNTPTGG